MTPHYCMKISNLLPENEEALIWELSEMGCLGTVQELEPLSPFPGEQLFGEARVDETLTLKAYFSFPPNQVRLDALIPHLGQALLAIEEEAPTDWLKRWKSSVQPFLFVPPFWIVPSWHQKPESVSQDHVLQIDPGLAFGSGLHSTTRLCGQALKDFVRPGDEVLDVGTGSGVLLVLAERLNAGNLHGVDIDPYALEAAAENFARHKINAFELYPEICSSFGSYELVIANILENVLIRLRDSLWQATAPGGHLILSGILREDKDRFLSAFGQTQNLMDERVEGDWYCAVFRRETSCDGI